MSRHPGIATVHPIPRLHTRLELPGDKSLSHRALLLGAMAEGQTVLLGLNEGADVEATRRAIEQLGVVVRRRGEAWALGSPGFDHWISPEGPVDCGNSGTTARLLLGLLASCPGIEATLFGDDSLTHRPMARVLDPLRAMGARLTDTAGHLPVSVEGGPLTGATWRSAVPSAQVKSAILLAGLHATGVTTAIETEPTRDHTERLFSWLATEQPGVMSEPVITQQASGATIVSVMPQQGTLRGFQLSIPRDPSAAAFWMVAALCHRDADVLLPDVLWNPTRNGLVRLLGDLIPTPDPARVSGSDVGQEAYWSPRIRTARRLPAFEIGSPGTLPASAVIDELPILALLATQAEGQSRIIGAGDLRVKESDRLAGTAALLSTLGARIRVNAADGWDIEGPTPLRGGTVDSLGDHRLAMTAGIAGLIAEGPVTIQGSRCIETSDPTFLQALQSLGALRDTP